ncbi:MAG: sulfite exporter TauE/SafE family protein [Nanoarchaeota archaeon]|nr:sulfite exporter TauE/SafE family protein [Nanoarchaeota archaeon]
MQNRLIILLMLAVLILSGISIAEDMCSAEAETCAVEPPRGYAETENVFSPVAKDAICIIYFYGDGCPNCAKLKPYIEEVKAAYGDKIAIYEYEIYHNVKNYQMYSSYCGLQDIAIEERGVPFLAIGNAYYMGVTQIKSNLEPKIEELLESGERICPIPEAGTCGNVKQSADSNTAIKNFKSTLSWPLVIGAGLVDGINPCAFAVLIFLLMFLLEVSNSRKRMVKIGLVYTVAVYVTYFIAGLGILSIIQVSGFSSWIVKIAAVLAILAGLVNVKDYFWYGKGFTLAIPESKKGIIERWTKKSNIPAAIVLGFLVSMFELPCTGGVYLAILAMLGNNVTTAQGIVYLLVYNLMFVLPLIAITGLVVLGMKAEHIERWRTSRKNLMKLAMGLLLLALGIAMLLGWI